MVICNGQLFQSDDEFLDAFLTCRVPASAFDHRGHLRVAWILLQKLPLESAVSETCDGIERLAAHLGAPGKYHRTLTEALVRIMAAMGGADRSTAFDAFLIANPVLVDDARALMARYYSAERLTDQAAKTTFLPPDLAAF